VRLLILGGTRFLGRHLAQVALDAGHAVTLFHRGVTGAQLFPDAEHIRGDRDGGLTALGSRTWDAAIDCCGYVPRVVGASARALQQRCGRYTFVSSVSAYRSPIRAGADEDAPLAALTNPATEAITGETYGGLKAACEREVTRAFGPRALIVRPGLIVGPFDPTDRFPYWPRRLARGGDVLAPMPPTLPVQVIDARDLAQWMLALVERGGSGTFHAVGPAEPLTIRECLERIREAVGGAARLIWVDGAFLLEQRVEPWTELPLWVTGEDVAHGTLDPARAIAQGLRFRPLEQSARDTLVWDLERGDAERPALPALTPEREAALLAAWAARAS
jgi:2'-hydroxyisoflavone reductase